MNFKITNLAGINFSNHVRTRNKLDSGLLGLGGHTVHIVVSRLSRERDAVSLNGRHFTTFFYVYSIIHPTLF